MKKNVNLQTLGMLLKPDRFLEQPTPSRSRLFDENSALTGEEKAILENTIRMGVMASPECKADDVILAKALKKLGLRTLASDVERGVV